MLSVWLAGRHPRAADGADARAGGARGGGGGRGGRAVRLLPAPRRPRAGVRALAGQARARRAPAPQGPEAQVTTQYSITRRLHILVVPSSTSAVGTFFIAFITGIFLRKKIFIKRTTHKSYTKIKHNIDISKENLSADSLRGLQLR